MLRCLKLFRVSSQNSIANQREDSHNQCPRGERVALKTQINSEKLAYSADLSHVLLYKLCCYGERVRERAVKKCTHFTCLINVMEGSTIFTDYGRRNDLETMFEATNIAAVLSFISDLLINPRLGIRTISLITLDGGIRFIRAT